MKRGLETGHVMVGSWINTCSPVVAELMAAAGFDFLTVDAEHSAADLPQVQAMFQAIRSGRSECLPFVRVPSAEYGQIKRYMDAGAAGVICPLVNTSAQAEEVVRAVKYPPLGQRGVGFCRANAYGVDLDAAVVAANDSTFVFVQIEHIDGVAHLGDILRVKGVDGVFIGPYDLTASMGITGQFSHPEYVRVRQSIVDACRSQRMAVGIHVVQPDVDALIAAAHDGYQVLAFSLDITMLTVMARGSMAAISQRLNRPANGPAGATVARRGTRP